MIRFRRRPAPEFWSIKAAAWESGTLQAKDALGLKHEGRTLAKWFHELVRLEDEPPLCAYCDGEIDRTSQQTIDHFYPVHAARWLALTWQNLFPACSRCNSTYKRKQYSCRLLRPDEDPVQEMLDFDPQTGRLRPAPAIGRRERARVRLTIRVFGLNDPARCRARLRVAKDVANTKKPPVDAAGLEDFINRREYRFVARLVLRALNDVSS